jgi:hypothetical protein
LTKRRADTALWLLTLLLPWMLRLNEQAGADKVLFGGETIRASKLGPLLLVGGQHQ